MLNTINGNADLQPQRSARKDIVDQVLDDNPRPFVLNETGGRPN